jgi:hypothetical protein
MDIAQFILLNSSTSSFRSYKDGLIIFTAQYSAR